MQRKKKKIILTKARKTKEFHKLKQNEILEEIWKLESAEYVNKYYQCLWNVFWSERRLDDTTCYQLPKSRGVDVRPVYAYAPIQEGKLTRTLRLRVHADLLTVQDLHWVAFVLDESWYQSHRIYHVQLTSFFYKMEFTIYVTSVYKNIVLFVLTSVHLRFVQDHLHSVAFYHTRYRQSCASWSVQDTLVHERILVQLCHKSSSLEFQHRHKLENRIP